MDNKLDWTFFLNSKNHFEIFNRQSELITSTFTHISNRFPQSRLKKIFTNSKGCKISKGFNLGGYPYQVLDVVRDFDKENGFNIRLLAWWGNGMYVFLTYGFAYAARKIKTFEELDNEYALAKSDLLFNYPELIKTVDSTAIQSLEQQITDKKVIQLWKTINLSNHSLQDEIELENLLGRLLDIHS